jgi:hypothetical protein
MIPKKATIRVYHTTVKVDDLLSSFDREYLEREGFTDDEIKNKIEELLRDSIWEHIPENKISIEFD